MSNIINDLHNHRISSIQAEMNQQGLDILIATSPQNVTYTSSAIIGSQINIPERLAFTVVPSSGAPFMLVCGIEEGVTRAQTPIGDVYTYVEGPEDPILALSALLHEKGHRFGTLGIEKRFLTFNYATSLIAHLSQFQITGADQLFEKVRYLKHDHEIAGIAHAARQTQAAIYSALDKFTIGMSELDLYQILAQELIGHGSSKVVSLTCCAGERTAILHAEPTSRPILNGDAIKIDIHGQFSGYLSDIARTAYAGTPSDSQLEQYYSFWNLHQKTLASPRNNMQVSEYLSVIKEIYDEFGFEFNVSHMGHSFGLGLHEYPLLTPACKEVLTNGVVLAVEPRAMTTNAERYHLEDPVLITSEKPKVLSDSEDLQTFIGVG